MIDKLRITRAKANKDLKQWNVLAEAINRVRLYVDSERLKALLYAVSCDLIIEKAKKEEESP